MQIIANFFAFFFDAWHKFVSPALPSACRHQPSCSQYGAQALREFGVFRGFWLAFHRIMRCQPWGTSGFDPLPTKKRLIEQRMLKNE
jgi:putative membrane protein insertion efficiency factor